MDPRVIIVAAVAENNVIGFNGRLAWELTSDLRRFKTLTEGGTVIMGRKTYESILDRLGGTLPNRVSVVLSHSYRTLAGPGMLRSGLADTVREFGADGRPVFVIGGASVYKEALPFAEELHLTIVHASPYGDTHFPSLHREPFEQRETKRFAANPAAGDQYDFSFCIFRRRPAVAGPGHVYLPNARVPRQWATMERIQLDGVCPFCPEHLSRYHRQPVLARTMRWTLTWNQWPYPNTKRHLLAIHRSHVERLAELDHEDWEELGLLASFAERTHHLNAGGIGIRFGDVAFNGGTVRHLHVQLLSADVTDPNDPAYRKVRLALN